MEQFPTGIRSVYSGNGMRWCSLLNAEMREKILYGARVPNPNSPGGLSNELRGAHSPKIKSRPDFVVDVICNNRTYAEEIPQPP